MESAVVSVRLNKGVKERLEKEGVDVAYEFKKYLQRRIALLELKSTIKELKAIVSKKVKPSEKGFAVRTVREDRRAAH